MFACSWLQLGKISLVLRFTETQQLAGPDVPQGFRRTSGEGRGGAAASAKGQEQEAAPHLLRNKQKIWNLQV